MNNIIANLRRDRPLSWENRLEAADEIFRLREENARLREENDAWRMDGGSCAGEVKRLREENARLVDLLDDVLAQWDGDWPEGLYARVKAAICEGEDNR